MSEDAAALRALWMSRPDRDIDLRTTVDRVLERDRAERMRERRMQMGGAAAMIALVPFLIWASAYGVAPIIRVAYALMAIGCAAGVVVQWLYLAWSRRALPGPSDMRTQLQSTAFMLECQRWLARTAVVWSSPVFIGVVFISVWLYRERTAAGALALCALDLAVWIGSGIAAAPAAAALDRRRRQLDEALADLGAEDDL